MTTEIKKVEINNLPLKAHQVHASNDKKTERGYLRKYLPFLNAPAEILGATAIFSSHLEELLGEQFGEQKYTPYSTFIPPINYTSKTPSVFGYKIFPFIKFADDSVVLSHGTLEDQSALFRLHEKVRYLEEMSEIVNCNKQRIHKG